MRLQKILIVLSVFVSMMSGCTIPEATNTTESTLDIADNTTYATEALVSSLLQAVELTLPDSIVRQSVSATRDYFYMNGEVIGGIELLDIAEQMDTMDIQSYVEKALAVTKAVYDTDYDYMASSGDASRVVVSVSSPHGREFYHYFFSGTQMGYDVWMDNAVLDTRDMRSYLKTLHSEDLYNPQDYITINADAPILNLRVEMPENITFQPTKTTRVLFYCGETLAGGIEEIEVSRDVDILGSLAVNLAKEMYSQEFNYSIAEDELDGNLVAQIITGSANTNMVHFILNVGAECYDVWTDTSIISEEDALLIAQSCQY